MSSEEFFAPRFRELPGPGVWSKNPHLRATADQVRALSSCVSIGLTQRILGVVPQSRLQREVTCSPAI